MTAPVAVGQWVCDTAGGGTQDLTVGGLTATPKAAIIKVVPALTVDVLANDNFISMGMIGGDGVGGFVSCAVGTNEQDGDAGGTDAGTLTTDSRVILITNRGLATAEAQASGVFITGGIRLTWVGGVYPAGAYIIIAQFFYGANVTSYLKLHTVLTGTPPYSSAVTGFGFKPQIAFHLTANTAAGGSLASDAKHSFGVSTLTPTGTVRQIGRAYRSLNNATTAMRLQISQAWVLANITTNLNTNAAVASHDVDGLTYTINTNAITHQFAILGLHFGPLGAADCGILNAPAATGSVEIDTIYNTVGNPSVDVGFKPGGIGLIPVATASLDTLLQADPDTSILAMGLSDGTTSYCVGAITDDGVTTSDTKALGKALVGFSTGSNGVTLHEMSLASFDANGFTLTCSKSDASVDKWAWWAIKQYGTDIDADGLLDATYDSDPTAKIEWKLNTAPTKALEWGMTAGSGLYYIPDADFLTGEDSIILDVSINGAATALYTATIEYASVGTPDQPRYQGRGRTSRFRRV